MNRLAMLDALREHDDTKSRLEWEQQVNAMLIRALRRIRDYKDDPHTPVWNSVKKSAIARAALTRAGDIT